MTKTDALSVSAPDSQRFGMNILRGKFPGARTDCKPLARAIFDADADVAIIRVPSAAQGLHGLSRWALPLIHADTLVYYRCDLIRHAPVPLRNADLAFRRADASDLDSLRGMIADTFRDYISHYHANPLFPREDILAGYQQWAEGHVQHPGATLWIAERNNRIAAFAACTESAEDGIGEGVLYGVSPDEAGGGVYGDLIRHTQADFAARGFHTMLVSTQVGNFAVQKVWAREGFHLFEAWDTYHVNAMLSAGEQVHSRPLVFSKEQVAAFASASGDMNPIHLDDTAARAAGFPGRISHGVLAAAELSRILGTETPGPGTIFGRLDMAFLQPIVAGAEYRLSLRIPGGIRRPGSMHGIVDIRDGQSRVCVYAHTDILLRS